jgi:hypothetical protein
MPSKTKALRDVPTWLVFKKGFKRLYLTRVVRFRPRYSLCRKEARMFRNPYDAALLAANMRDKTGIHHEIELKNQEDNALPNG